MAAERQNDATPRVSLAEVAHALKAIIPEGQVTEVRALRIPFKNGTYNLSGFFDSIDAIIQAFKEDSRVLEADGVYFTPNPIKRDLLARSANKLHRAEKGEAASDINIESRRWLLIDADPVRIAGISSTDTEHSAAHARMDALRAALASAGWLAPIVADSGNGAHAMYRIDLTNDESSAALVNKCLQALALRFSDNVVTIDTTVSNAARIWKLYGTVARKGSHLADRPHRQARVIELPEVEQVVTREQLEVLAATLPRDEMKGKRQPEAGYNGAPFNLAQWIADHRLDVESPHDWNGAQVWPFNHCPFSSEHADGAVLIQFSSGALCFRCHHNSCQGRTWQDLREQYEPGCYNRTARGNISDFAQRQESPKEANTDDTAFQITSHRLYDNTDTGNAHRLMDGYGHLIRYVVEWKKWIVWNGKKWEIDQVNAGVMGLAVKTVLHIKRQAETLLEEAKDPDFAKDKSDAEILEHEARGKALYKHAMTSQNRRPYDSMIFIAQAFRTIGADRLDADPFVVNMPNGTFDIRTGMLREHRRDDFLTKMTRASYDPTATAPQWEALISWAMCNRHDLIAYLKRAYGYGVTGSVREDKIFFEYGKGGNGKSIIADSLYYQLGDYAGRVDKETLLHKKNNSVGVDVAQLEGKRFTIAGENNEGDRLDEGTIKTMLEHDQHGRVLYVGYRDFITTHKIFYYTNHLPEIKSDTRATWRRIAVIPFDATALSADEIRELPQDAQANATPVDTHLSERLASEAAGIMKWALDGAVAWYREGLGTCQEVKEATYRYRKDMDTTGQFLVERTRPVDKDNSDERNGTQATMLYDVYQQWCIEVKELPMKQRAFLRAIEARGYPLARLRTAFFFTSLWIDDREYAPACALMRTNDMGTESATNPGAERDCSPDMQASSAQTNAISYNLHTPARTHTQGEVIENAVESAQADQFDTSLAQASAGANALFDSDSFVRKSAHAAQSQPVKKGATAKTSPRGTCQYPTCKPDQRYCGAPAVHVTGGVHVCDKHYAGGDTK